MGKHARPQGYNREAFLTVEELFEYALDLLRNDPETDGEHVERKHPRDAFAEAMVWLSAATAARTVTHQQLNGRA